LLATIRDGNKDHIKQRQPHGDPLLTRVSATTRAEHNQFHGTRDGNRVTRHDSLVDRIATRKCENNRMEVLQDRVGHHAITLFMSILALKI
jgi:hypothetical protein